MKNERGITLIALIITIIVILILAGVSISLTLGDNGILKNATSAVTLQKEAALIEEAELAIATFEIDYLKNKSVANNLEAYIKSKIEDDADKTLEFPAGGKLYLNSDSKITYEDKNSNVVIFTFDANGNIADEEIKQNNAPTVTQPQLLSSVAKPGNLVNYNGGNGYEGVWQVLYNDETNGLQIISANAVKRYGLSAANYNEAINILNSQCAAYVNETFASSGRCVGSNPTSPADTVTSTMVSSYRNSNITHSTDVSAMTTAGIHIINSDYWLASRQSESLGGAAARYSFDVKYMNSTGSVQDCELVKYVAAYGTNPPSTTEGGGYYGLRPVITLLPNVKCTGDGSSNAPFELIEP